MSKSKLQTPEFKTKVALESPNARVGGTVAPVGPRKAEQCVGIGEPVWHASNDDQPTPCWMAHRVFLSAAAARCR